MTAAMVGYIDTHAALIMAGPTFASLPVLAGAEK